MMSENFVLMTQDEINQLLGFGSSTQIDEDKEEQENKHKKAIEALEGFIKDMEIEVSVCDKYDDPEEVVAVIRDTLDLSNVDKAEESNALNLDERIDRAKKKSVFDL